MNTEEFIEYSRIDADLARFIAEVAAESTPTDREAPQRFLVVAPTDAVWLSVAYASARLVKFGVDWLSDRSAEKTARARIALIEQLIREDQYPRAEAEKTVNALFKNLSARSADDAVIKKLTGL